MDGRPHHVGALRLVEVGELAGRAERGEPMHAGLDEIVGEPRQHAGLDAAVGVDRRDQIRKDPVKLGHSETLRTLVQLYSKIGARNTPAQAPARMT